MAYVIPPTSFQRGKLKMYNSVTDLKLRVQLTRELEVSLGLIPTIDELILRINEVDDILELNRTKRIQRENEMMWQQIYQLENQMANYSRFLQNFLM